MSAPGRWLACWKCEPRVRMRLVCIPQAGGFAASFRSWHEELPEGVEVCAVELPGHGRRRAEAPYRRMAPVVRALAEELAGRTPAPIAAFGHSMGSLIGFELACELRRRGMPGFDALFLSGAAAPHLRRPFPPMHRLPDDEFVRRLLPTEAAGAADDALRQAMELAVPILRADFELVETLGDERPAPIDSAVRVFGGMADPIVRLDQLLAWRELTTGPFAVRLIAGDHFFPQTARAILLREIAHGLERYVRGSS